MTKKMTNLYGWAGKILWVDLTSRKISKVPTSDFEPEKYIGGVGLNSRIFWELGCPKIEAFLVSQVKHPIRSRHAFSLFSLYHGLTFFLN